MQEEHLIIWVYCFVDDFLSTVITERIRKRGKMPKLTDAEVLTMEIVGEFLGIDENKAIWQYFHTHWLHFFPQMGSRSQFAKQMNGLCLLKQHILAHLFARHGDENVHIVDGFPLPVAHYNRAHNCKRFKGEASFSYCASKDMKYYGFEGHLLVTLDGEIVSFCLTTATKDERPIARQLMEGKTGMLLGDKGYLGKKFSSELMDQEVELITPVRCNMKETLSKPWRNKLTSLRRKIETTIGQLTEQFNIEKTKARTMYTLTNRLARKLISHCLGCLINKENGQPPTQLVHVLN